MTNEELSKQLTIFIYDNIRVKRWLYYPPGPMMGQVFDKELCEKDCKRFLDNVINPI